MGRTTKKIGLTQRGSDEGNKFTSRTSRQIEDYYSGGKRSFSYKKNVKQCKLKSIKIN